MKLADDELEFFNTNGYIILRNFATKKDCKKILDIAKIHLKHKVAPIETEAEYNLKDEKKIVVRRLRQVYNRDTIFKEWMENKKVRPILKQIFKETPVITLAHHNSIMTKMPQSSTQTSWHQDIRYWNFTNDNLLSIWLALDTEISENGVLEFIPKSHKIKFKRKQFDKKEYFRVDYKTNRELINTKVSTTLNRGDVVLFHSKLLHRANKNTTNKPKISFVYTVRALSNPAIKNTRSSQYGEVILPI